MKRKSITNYQCVKCGENLPIRHDKIIWLQDGAIVTYTCNNLKCCCENKQYYKTTLQFVEDGYGKVFK